MTLDVHVENLQGALDIDVRSVPAVVDNVLALEGVEADEISIQFLGPNQTAQLHGEYFNDYSVTDCMSFPMDRPGEDYRVLGDVVVCPLVAIQYAREHDKEPYEETTLYLVHGILHLLGYNDIEEGDRERMRAAEARHMDSLREQGLFLRPIT